MIELEPLGDEVLNRKMLFADLSENAKQLFVELSQFPNCLLILHFLHSNAATLLTADDIAYFVGKPIEEIESDLSTLTQLGLVETTSVTGVTFYRFTTNPMQRKLAQELCNWQDRWAARIHTMTQFIWGIDSSPTRVAQPHASVSRVGLEPIEKPGQRWVASMNNSMNGGKNG